MDGPDMTTATSRIDQDIPSAIRAFPPQFEHPAWEDAFQRAQLPTRRQALKPVLALAIAFIVISTGLDLSLLGWNIPLFELVTLRLYFAALCLLLIIHPRLTENTVTVDRMLFFGEALFTCVLLIELGFLQESLANSALPVAVTVLVYFLAVPTHFMTALVNTLMLLGLFVGFMAFWFESTIPQWGHVLLMLLVAFSLGMVASQHRHRSQRQQFMMEQVAQTDRQVIETQARAERDLDGALEIQKENFERLFETCAAPLLLVVTETGEMKRCNKAANRLHSWLTSTDGDSFGRLFIHPEEYAEVRTELDNGRNVTQKDVFLRGNGNQRLSASLSASTVNCGGQPCILASWHDNTAVRQMERRLHQLATVDSLTGALTRQNFFEQASLEMKRFQRHRRPLSLVLMDVDQFMKVNDEMGHAMGDRVLAELTHRCRGELRAEDIIGRIGGEEFAFLLPETNEHEAVETTKRLRAAIEGQPYGDFDKTVTITVSAGISACQPSDDRVDLVMTRADRALHRAKRMGQGKVVKLIIDRIESV